MASTIYVNSVTLSDAAEWNKWDTAAYCALSGASGTNTITATGPANLTSVATNPPLWFIPAATNTGATTLNITPSGGAALGAKNIFYNGTACVGGEIRIGVPCAVVYDGTQYNLLNAAQNIVLGTPQASTSGTSIDFTGIPAWVKTITVMFLGVSTNGTSPPLIQIGPSGGPETTAYACASSNNGAAVANFTTGFGINSVSAAGVMHGAIVLSLQNVSSFNWVASGNIAYSSSAVMLAIAGAKTLAGVLTQVRITTVNGTDAFDAGAINISYE